MFNKCDLTKTNSKLEKRLLKAMEEAIGRWNMFSENERIIVGISGGKDSLTLLTLLSKKYKNLLAVHVQLSPENDVSFKKYCENLTEFYIIKSNILSDIQDQKKNPCFLCSRKRRKLILEFAEQENIRKIAFGHHRDDVIETLLMNIIYSREISTMLPLQELFSGRFEIIRPLYLIEEALIQKYALEQKFPNIKQACEFESVTKRKYMRKVINSLQNDHPNINIKNNIFHSLKFIKKDFLPFPIFTEK